MATYFGSKPVSDWTANGSAETGHDFINQINKQQADIDTAKNEYQAQKGNVDTSQQTYNDLFNNRTGYGDFYEQAKSGEGVNEAKEQYQKSLNAVNATNSAMNTLPSSINANSNVVLTANQRNAALGNQMAKYQNTMDYWTRQNAGDQSMYQTALGAAQTKAGQQVAQQQADIQTALANYQSQMDQLNQMYQNVLNEKNVMRSIYGDMYDDEYNHMQQQIQIWADNLQAETSRYAEQQANYRAQLSKQASDYAADAGMRLQNYMNQNSQQPGFLDYVNSEAYINAMPSDMSDAEKRTWAQRLANNYQSALQSQNYNDLQNIYSGSAYQGYRDWLNS